jgi:hypothetical protein
VTWVAERVDQLRSGQLGLNLDRHQALQLAAAASLVRDIFEARREGSGRTSVSSVPTSAMPAANLSAPA